MRPRHCNPLDRVTMLAKRLHDIDDRYHDWNALSAEQQDRYLLLAETAIAWCKHETNVDAEFAR